MTVESDVSVPKGQIPQHRALAFVNALEVIVKNCLFQNNQNFLVFSFRNYNKFPFYSKITESYLTLENITVLNNSGIFNDASYLFGLYSPQKPVNVLFANSFFYNNTIGKLFLPGRFLMIFFQAMD